MKHLSKMFVSFMLGAGCVYAIHLKPSTDIMIGAAIVFVCGLLILSDWSR